MEVRTIDEKAFQSFKQELNALLETASDAGENVLEANDEVEDALREVEETFRLFRNALRLVADRIDTFLFRTMPNVPVLPDAPLGMPPYTPTDSIDNLVAKMCNVVPPVLVEEDGLENPTEPAPNTIGPLDSKMYVSALTPFAQHVEDRPGYTQVVPGTLDPMDGGTHSCFPFPETSDEQALRELGPKVNTEIDAPLEGDFTGRAN